MALLPEDGTQMLFSKRIHVSFEELLVQGLVSLLIDRSVCSKLYIPGKSANIHSQH